MPHLPNDFDQGQLYRGNGQANDYTFMSGVVVLPLAEDPPTDPLEQALYTPVVIARIHAPYRLRQHTFSAYKQNNPPVLPAPKDQGAFVFIGGDVSITTKMTTNGLSFDWVAMTEYTFVENCISRLEDGLVLGTSVPFTIDSDRAGVIGYGHSIPSIGAVAYAGPNAVAGYNLGNLIAPNGGATTIPQSGGNQSHNPYNPRTGMAYSWTYALSAFYPGNFFNDQLANGGGTDFTA